MGAVSFVGMIPNGGAGAASAERVLGIGSAQHAYVRARIRIDDVTRHIEATRHKPFVLEARADGMDLVAHESKRS